MNDTKSLVLKSDLRGRVRTPAAQREALLDEFERSGLSAARFAPMTGVKYQTFCSWLQKRRRQSEPSHALVKPPMGPRFVEAIARGPQRAALLLRLPGQASVELSEPAQAGLIAVLLRKKGVRVRLLTKWVRMGWPAG